jgi:hypothetical protein
VDILSLIDNDSQLMLACSPLALDKSAA